MMPGPVLLLKGLPLWGDLSQNGYRSQNGGVAMTAEDAISMGCDRQRSHLYGA